MVLHLILYCLDVQFHSTPLLHAANEGHMDVLKLLLSEGAAVDAVDKVTIFIMLSCWKGTFDLIVRHLYGE